MPKKALNMSDKKDSRANVKENIRRLLESLELKDIPVVLGRQTHSDLRFWVCAREPLIKTPPEVDSFTSRRPNVLIGVKTADCVPILLADPSTNLKAAVHAGWRGTLSRIVQKTITDLKLKGVNPKKIIAAIGPAACGQCYEVGPEVVSQFKAEFRGWKKFITPLKQGKALLDTQIANQQQLLEAGVSKANIHVASFCTIHHNDLFFSQRKEAKAGAFVGRQVSIIGRITDKENIRG